MLRVVYFVGVVWAVAGALLENSPWYEIWLRAIFWPVLAGYGVALWLIERIA